VNADKFVLILFVVVKYVFVYLTCVFVCIYSLYMYMPSTLRNVNNLDFDCEIQLGVTYKRQDFEWFFVCLMCTKMGLKKSSLYSYIFSFFVLKPWATWSTKSCGLTIVQFLNKLIVSCKEAVQVPFYFFGGLFLNWIVIFYSN
jgi:hypothetical protein